MENAIKIAIKGGWGVATNYRPELKSYMDAYHFYGKSWPGYYLDPLFWQALGKAEGWRKETIEYHIDTQTWNRERQAFIDGYVEKKIDTWKYHWHRFIDHLAENKPVDKFFDNLLKK